MAEGAEAGPICPLLVEAAYDG